MSNKVDEVWQEELTNCKGEKVDQPFRRLALLYLVLYLLLLVRAWDFAVQRRVMSRSRSDKRKERSRLTTFAHSVR